MVLCALGTTDPSIDTRQNSKVPLFLDTPSTLISDMNLDPDGTKFMPIELNCPLEVNVRGFPLIAVVMASHPNLVTLRLLLATQVNLA